MTESGATEKGYAICGEPRSGSTYLAQLLQSTGVLGRPFEFFRTVQAAAAAERDPVGELERMVREASSPNGVYGFKIFAWQFDFAEKSGWADRLPGLHFVHLERLDLLGQAISLVRAEQTGRYFPGQPAHAEPRYDRSAIARALRRLALNQARWRLWFARNGIVPLRLTYEGVVADPPAAARAVGAHLGIAEPFEIRLDQVDVPIARDEVNQAWRAAFLADSHDRSRLDHPFGRLPVLIRRWRA